METRSRKSRSRTPFTQFEAYSKEFVEKETLAEESVRTTRSTITTKVNEIKADAVTVDEVTSTNVRPIKKSSSQSERESRKWFKTSDYSSEDGENEVSSTKSISLNEKNQFIKDAKAASSNGSGRISALDLYKKSGRYWDNYPKTDYTYSPYSTDRVEIAPGVVAMPNMSRKTIHSVNSSSDDSHILTNVEHKQTNTDLYSSRNVQDYQTYKPRQLFNNNYESTYSNSSQKTDITVWSRIRTRTVTTISTVITTILSIVYFGFKVQTSWFTKLHKLTSRVMLMDTWLLWKNNVGNKAAKLTALCVIPLLLLGGWWLWLNLGSSLNADKSEVPTDITVNSNVVLEDKYTNIPTLSSDDSYKSFDENEIFINQQKLIDSLKNEVTKIRSEILEAEKIRQEDMSKMIQGLNVEKTDKTVYLTQRINRCCKNPMIDMESYISRILVNLLNDPEFLRNQKGFTDYLRTIFVARQELEYSLGNITANIDDKYINLINENSVKLMDGINSRIKREIEKLEVETTASGEVTISDQRIKQIVRSVLAIYDADKTGLVDYAMESMGAQILSTRCTENYHYGKAVVSVLGIPLWYPVNSPRTLISPGISPGHCWAFQNFPGFVMIRLSKRIKIEAFSFEHINRLLVPNGEIDSAPKHFEVYGLTDENDREPTLLGEYIYDYNGESLQFFDVQKDGQIFEIVELRVISNHGNPNYTCLYRFRVHGKSVS